MFELTVSLWHAAVGREWTEAQLPHVTKCSVERMVGVFAEMLSEEPFRIFGRNVIAETQRLYDVVGIGAMLRMVKALMIAEPQEESVVRSTEDLKLSSHQNLQR